MNLMRIEILTNKYSRIIGIGSHTPERILTNADLEKMVDTDNDWIVQRTGIKERRIAAADETTSDMGYHAARKAIESSKIEPSQIDFIICATMTPDYISSSVASILQEKIGANQAGAVDIQAACTGFIYALSMAKAYVESGMYNNVLVVAAEKMSTIVDYEDRSTCILFGDGAAAVVVSNEGEGLAIEDICLGSDGARAELISIPAGGSRIPITKEAIDQKLHFFRQEGKEVFKHAVRRMAGTCADCLQKIGATQDEVSWLVSHQANERIIDALAKKMKFPQEKIIKTVSKYGNTSASSVPLALDELLQNNPIASGELILLTAFGAGLTWGAVALRKILF